MHNIVDFAGRVRPRRSIQIPADGAQILFFTGVRYVRDAAEDVPSFVPEATPFVEATVEAAVSSAAALDLTAH